MSQAAADPAAKRSVLRRRTRVGLSLAAVVLLAVWGAVQLGSTLPVLALSLLVLAACILEVARMGALRPLRLWIPLSVTALLVGGWTWDVLAAADASLRDPPDPGMGLSWLAAVAPLALVASLGAYALVRAASLGVRIAALAFLAGILGGPFLPATDVLWTSLVALGLFLLLRLTVIGAQHPREALAAVPLMSLLCVSIPGFAWIWGGFGAGGLLTLLAICKLGDSAGYFVGSTLGRHHPFRGISPGKTTEGCLASLVAGAAVGAGAVAAGLLPPGAHGVWGGLLAGAVVNVAGQAGDLLESWVKRKAGVKDSATYLGPSGGVLDLVDSFLLATPVALMAWPWILAP